MPGKFLGVDGGRGDDDPQVRASRQQLPQITQDKVDIQAALVRLVNHQGVISIEMAIMRGLGEQDAVCHELDEAFRAQALTKAHLVSHGGAQGGA